MIQPNQKSQNILNKKFIEDFNEITGDQDMLNEEDLQKVLKHCGLIL